MVDEILFHLKKMDAQFTKFTNTFVLCLSKNDGNILFLLHSYKRFLLKGCVNSFSREING